MCGEVPHIENHGIINACRASMQVACERFQILSKLQRLTSKFTGRKDSKKRKKSGWDAYEISSTSVRARP
jgi:hypothetical protein